MAICVCYYREQRNFSTTIQIIKFCPSYNQNVIRCNVRGKYFATLGNIFSLNYLCLGINSLHDVYNINTPFGTTDWGLFAFKRFWMIFLRPKWIEPGWNDTLRSVDSQKLPEDEYFNINTSIYELTKIPSLMPFGFPRVNSSNSSPHKIIGALA